MVGRKLNILFFVPSLIHSGGNRVVIEHGRRLAAYGHTVKIVYPVIPPSLGSRAWSRALRSIMGQFLANTFQRTHIWETKTMTFLRVPRPEDRYVGPCDIAVATTWVTAYWVARLRGANVKLYLVHHREIDLGPTELVDGTYSLGMPIVTVSDYTKHQLETLRGVRVRAVIGNGIDTVLFHPKGRTPVFGNDGKVRVLIYYRASHRKGGDLAISLAEWLINNFPRVELTFLTSRRIFGLPRRIQQAYQLTDPQLAELYRSHDVFVYPSRFEGFGLPPLEAMACGCLTIAPRVGAIPDYAEDRKHAYLFSPGDFEEMKQVLKYALDHPEEAQRVAVFGSLQASLWSWDRQTMKLLALFHELLGSAS